MFGCTAVLKRASPVSASLMLRLPLATSAPALSTVSPWLRVVTVGVPKTGASLVPTMLRVTTCSVPSAATTVKRSATVWPAGRTLLAPAW